MNDINFSYILKSLLQELKDLLVKEILAGVEVLIEASQEKSINQNENWTTKETAKYCKVTVVTIGDWTNKGILKKYKIGNRVFYKKNEVLEAINLIEK